MMIKCEIHAKEEFGDYWAKLIFSYNRKSLGLDEDLLNELGEEVDFVYGQEGNFQIDGDSSIICEISKYHWGVFEFEDEYYKKETEEVMKEHCESAELIFKKQLVRNLGVYSIASELVSKKLLDNNEIASVDDGKVDKISSVIEQGFEDLSLEELYNLSDETIEKKIKEELL